MSARRAKTTGSGSPSRSAGSPSRSAGSPSRSAGSPSRSAASPTRPANRRPLTPVNPPRGETPDQGSETEASAISEGIPPKSIKHMRDNLRHMIDMMGDDNNCGCVNDNSYCNSPATTECNEAVSRASYVGECCRCCGKQTSSSESGGEYCMCNVTKAVEPEVHRTCIGKSEEMIVAKSQQRQDRYPCIDRSDANYRTLSIDRQYRAFGKREVSKPVSTSSSEECPCEGPCPGKQNARKKIKNFLNKVVGIKENIQTQHELYKFRLKQQDPNFKLPRQLIFDLVDGIPKAPPVQKEKRKKPLFPADLEDYNNKVDVYYFDHGNSGYYRTTDHPPPLMADFFIEQTDLYATRFWAEIFGTIHIGVAFVTTFLLQLFRFVFYSVLRPLTVGLIQLASDYFFKPLLSILFNGIIQPLLILMYNIATSFRDLCEPIAQGVGYFLREIAGVFRAVRLVEVNKMKSNNSPCGVI